ncbi:unnamed protein product [Pleuronectes platessa]|uniref:Uncharacterized protein n=1 Tax=Pleuronectes platessa TaxID=8262 RepID=A0A9N7YZ90_PLEPL|nr:unnamed protein product [Pleuronectes platessa]
MRVIAVNGVVWLGPPPSTSRRSACRKVLPDVTLHYDGLPHLPLLSHAIPPPAAAPSGPDQNHHTAASRNVPAGPPQHHGPQIYHLPSAGSVTRRHANREEDALGERRPRLEQ